MSKRSKKPENVAEEVWARLDEHAQKLNKLLSRIKKLEDVLLVEPSND